MLADTQSPEERGGKPHDDRQWTQYPTELRGHDLAQVDVYLDYFISTCQGGPTKRRQMLHHLFRSKKLG